MRAALVLCALVAVALAAPASRAATPPSLDRAAAAILVDAGDGRPLLQKDPNEHRAMASTTKLMTALLALERAKPTAVFTAPAYSAIPAESKIDLRRGERMTVHDLLQALLLESANDAAVTIADGVSGSTRSFVAQMNRRAAQLHLAETSYANPIGLDDPDNYSSPRDLARLAGILMRKPRFARIVDRTEAVLTSGSHRRVVRNRNLLVGRYPFVDGVKTGHTIDAGYVLVGAADERDARVISVVMGEPSESARDSDTLSLLRYGLAQFHPVRALRAGRAVATAGVKHRDEKVDLVPRRSLRVTVRKGQRVTRRIDAPGELDGPLPAHRRVGSVAVLRDGRVVGKADLVTASAVPGAGALRVVTSVLGVPLTLLLLAAMLVAVALAALRLRIRPGRRDRTPTGAP